jgi:hypothetical protein
MKRIEADAMEDDLSNCRSARGGGIHGFGQQLVFASSLRKTLASVPALRKGHRTMERCAQASWVN